MNTSIQIKSVIAKMMECSGLVENIIRGKNTKCKYIILNYHRVIPYKEGGTGLQAGMYVEPETFDMQIQYLKKHFYIIPICEIKTKLNSSSAESSDKAICILTFDDGWFDFFKYAYPILLAHEVPATVFLPTKFIGSEDWFWTDQLTRLFVESRGKVIKKYGISSDSIAEKLLYSKGSIDTRIENAISILKDFREEEIFNIIAELEKIVGVDPVLKGRVFLTWEEIRKMSESGLVTFGSHTVSHRILVHLNKEEIIEELIQSKIRLISERVVIPSFVPFCYPNGNYDGTVLKLVKEAGYDLAVTIENGWNHPTSPIFQLHRISIHQDISSTKEMFGCRIAGIF